MEWSIIQIKSTDPIQPCKAILTFLFLRDMYILHLTNLNQGNIILFQVQDRQLHVTVFLLRIGYVFCHKLENYCIVFSNIITLERLNANNHAFIDIYVTLKSAHYFMPLLC